MENNFKEIAESSVIIEVHETPGGVFLFGLKWGEGRRARLLGFKRRNVIDALNWADKNPKVAMGLLGMND